jgi:hypothetical protein
VPELEGPECTITVFDRHQDVMQFFRHQDVMQFFPGYTY